MTAKPPLNPYSPPEHPAAKGSFGDGAERLKGGFLYRKIKFTKPFEGVFYYNGWNFLQRIFINEQLVWKRISWIVIHRRAMFRIPAEVDPREPSAEMEIHFGPGLWIRRFTIRIDDVVVYDE